MIHGLLLLIFFRPFICSLILPERNLYYAATLSVFLIIWIGLKKVALPEKNITAATAVFTGIFTLSSLLSGSHLAAAAALSQYINGILLFLICRALPWRHANKMFHGLTAAGILISCIGIYQFLFSFHNALDFLTALKVNDHFLIQQIRQKRVFAVFITSNALGSYLAMLLPLVLGLRKKFWLIPCVITLLLTQSVGAFMTLLLIFPFYAYQRRLINPAVFGLFAALIVTGAGLIFWRTHAHVADLDLNHSITMRWQYWKETWDVIMTSPLAGTGLGNFDIPSVRYSHNIILQLWAETGLAGLLAFLYLILTVLRHGWTSLTTAAHPERSAALLFGATIFLVNNLIDFTFFLPEVALVWCVILGLACNRSAPTDASPMPATSHFDPTRKAREPGA